MVTIGPHSLAEYGSRLKGIVSPSFSERTVVAVGCGAGSYMVEKLARYGPRRLRLIDPDRVEWPNLSRTAYGIADIGSPKVDALARRIAAVHPRVAVETVPADITALSDPDLLPLLSGCDLILAGTDSFAAQSLLNRWGLQLGIACLWVGIHTGAEGGRIVWSVPAERTPCYRCIAGDRYEEHERTGSAGTDLAGEVGSLVDGQLIDMVALKIALAILDRGQASALGRFYEAIRGKHEVIVRCSPSYGYGATLTEAVLGDLPTEPKQYAEEIRELALFCCDTFWLPSQRDPLCPDCGPRAAETQVDP